MWVLGAIAAGFLTLASLVLNRTDAINTSLGAKIDAVDAKLTNRIDGLDQKLSALSERTARIEGRLPEGR